MNRDDLNPRYEEALRVLGKRERRVIELRFGLADGYPRTLDDVAKALRISREAVRRIEARALLRIQRREPPDKWPA
jgi:RNA polymerase primary sigma factor